MSEPATPEIVEFDAGNAVRAAREVVDGTLYTFVEFDAEAFNPLYVGEATRALYDSEEQMEAHFARIHRYVNIDFMEAELFTDDLFPMAERVRYKTTALDVMTILRYYVDEGRGLFLALDRGEPVEPVVTAIETAIER